MFQEIWLNTTEELRRYTTYTNLLEKHQSVLLIPDSICNSTTSTAADIVQEFEGRERIVFDFWGLEQYGKLMFDYQLIDVPLPVLVDEARDLYKLDNYEK